MAAVTEPIVGPTPPAGAGATVSVPRLARRSFTLEDGHRVGLAVSGRGVPLVVVHGFTAEGFLYAQTLHRLVGLGFKVIAIDMAGHGATQGLPLSGGHLGDYAELMGRVIEELGIRKAVIAGHSMGGRVTAQLAAQRPERTVAAREGLALAWTEMNRSARREFAIAVLSSSATKRSVSRVIITSTSG
jgi:pimeloyl-ACP methyl ester carboxylesterase